MDKYEKVADIGKGSFGTVSKIKRKSDGRYLVWKELNYGRMSEKEKQMLVSEVNILRDLRHTNIVKYYDRIIDKANCKIFIIMELCEGGDIAKMIKVCKQKRSNFSEDFIWNILHQMLNALNHCHTRSEGKIIHRDLKPGNVFLDSQNNVKLGDFGLSRVLGEESVFIRTRVGTPYYMSPQQIEDQRYSERCDIWSAGCIIYELATLRAPFEATTHYQLAQKIKAGKIEKLPSQYSDDLWNLIQRMLTQEENRRPSAQELLQLPQLKIRCKQADHKDTYEKLKQREKEIAAAEKALKEKEEEIKRKQEEQKEREQKLRAREKALQENQENIRYHMQLNAASQSSVAASAPGGPTEKGGVPASLQFKQRRNSFKQQLEDITKKIENKYMS